MQLEQADLKSAFAEAHAKGALPQVEGNFNVKLDAMYKQLGEVFDLGNLLLAGEVSGKTPSRPGPEGPQNSEKVAITVSVDCKNVVAESGPVPTPASRSNRRRRRLTMANSCAGHYRARPNGALIVAEGSAGIPRLIITTPTDKAPDNFDVFAADPRPSATT